MATRSAARGGAKFQPAYTETGVLASNIGTKIDDIAPSRV
jgi:hypothetical protein